MAESAVGGKTLPRRWMAIGLSLTLLLQMGVLAAEYLGSVWPLWFGNAIMVKTAPVDPRSLFRGNYVQLSYAISSVDDKLTSDDFSYGEVGYVTLRKEGDLYVATGLQRERPSDGTFIRGRVRSTFNGYRLEYGIEAYFMPKDKALQTEKEVVQGARAEIYLLPSGKAAISRLICDNGACGQD